MSSRPQDTISWESSSAQAFSEWSTPGQTPAHSDDGDAMPSAPGKTALHPDEVTRLTNREHEIWDRTLPGYNLCFHYQHQSTKDLDAYHAVVLVRAKSIEKLMKKGFHLNQRNVVPRRSFLVQPPDHTWISMSEWKVIRSLEMCDTSYIKNWKAVIWVYANTLPPLANFRVSDLTPENCTQAKGWDINLIYFYNRKHPQLCINTWLDDRPMEGIWPWPRPEQSSSRSPEPRAVSALKDISAWSRIQRITPSNLPYPQIVRALKGNWFWLCGAFGLLTLLKPDANRSWDDVLHNYLGGVIGITAAYLFTLLAIFAFALPFLIIDDVLGKKT